MITSCRRTLRKCGWYVLAKTRVLPITVFLFWTIPEIHIVLKTLWVWLHNFEMRNLYSDRKFCLPWLFWQNLSVILWEQTSLRWTCNFNFGSVLWWVLWRAAADTNTNTDWNTNKFYSMLDTDLTHKNNRAVDFSWQHSRAFCNQSQKRCFTETSLSSHSCYWAFYSCDPVY